MDKKVIALIAVVAVVVVAVAAVFVLNNGGDDDSDDGVKDAAGNIIKPIENPGRIATTTNVGAELLSDLGFMSNIVGITSPSSSYDVENHIVGIDMEFVYPGTLAADLDSGKIQSVGRYFGWSAETVAAVNPEVVIIDYNQISSDDSKMKQLQSLGLTVIVLDTDYGFPSILKNYTMLGKIFKKEAEAEKLVDAMQKAYDKVKEVVKKSDLAGKKFALISHCPPYGDYSYGKHAVISLLEDCGLVNAMPSGGQASQSISLGEALASANPDFVIFEDMGMSLIWSDVIAGWKSDDVMGSIDCIKNDKFYCLEYKPFQSFYHTKQAINGYALVGAIVNPEDTGVTVPNIVTSAAWTDYIQWLDEY
ncbi:MAG: ABC transporter substrate-binding protein [Thermoplasmata archaeon]|nr:ABC transporter substrate-binding protein [Thermoplasmata archaeon]